MTNTDQELFDLCREVYEKTKWAEDFDGGHWCVNDNFQLYSKTPPEYEGDIPLYTSDYLLEKLPAYVNGGHIEMFYEEDEGAAPWCFGYHFGNERVYLSDKPDSYAQGYGYTPLKALLKLTLKLIEEGVEL